MDKLLAYKAEPFPELDTETNVFNTPAGAEEWAGELAWEENEVLGELESADSEFTVYESAAQWQGETPHKSHDRVRWIQRSLNRILRVRLKVDGIMGPQTKSAIRAFQKMRRLKVDGIVGPVTTRALITCGATPPGPGALRPEHITPAAARLTGFDFDKVTLKAAHRAVIAKLVAEIESSWHGRRPVIKVKIVGHADPEGGAQYNQALALRRALAVRAELHKTLSRRGHDLVAKVKLQTVTKGEDEPLVRTSSRKGNARNRRVEIFLLRRALPGSPHHPWPPPQGVPDPHGDHHPHHPSRCDQVRYQKLKKIIYRQAIGEAATCARNFGLVEAKVVKEMAGMISEVLATSKMPPNAMLIAVIGTVLFSGLSAHKKQLLFRALTRILARMLGRLKKAKRLTHC